jgi:hypothetical protein
LIGLLAYRPPQIPKSRTSLAVEQVHPLPVTSLEDEQAAEVISERQDPPVHSLSSGVMVPVNVLKQTGSRVLLWKHSKEEKQQLMRPFEVYCLRPEEEQI